MNETIVDASLVSILRQHRGIAGAERWSWPFGLVGPLFYQKKPWSLSFQMCFIAIHDAKGSQWFFSGQSHVLRGQPRCSFQHTDPNKFADPSFHFLVCAENAALDAVYHVGTDSRSPSSWWTNILNANISMISDCWCNPRSLRHHPCCKYFDMYCNPLEKKTWFKPHWVS